MGGADPKGYYADLGVSPSASEDEIKAVYRALAKRYHPDVNKDRFAVKKFRTITEAYEVLANTVRRADYDRQAREDSHHRESDETRPPREPMRPVYCWQCDRVTAQPRYLTFQYVCSYVIPTKSRRFSGVYCSDCAPKVALRASVASAIYGWWGVFGPIATILAIARNASGGERSPEIDERLYWQNMLAFLDGGKPELAMSLAQELVTARNAALADGARVMIEGLSVRGFRAPRLQSNWTGNRAWTVAHVLVACAVPAIFSFLLFKPVDARSPRAARPELPALSLGAEPIDMRDLVPYQDGRGAASLQDR